MLNVFRAPVCDNYAHNLTILPGKQYLYNLTQKTFFISVLVKIQTKCQILNAEVACHLMATPLKTTQFYSGHRKYAQF